MMKFFNEGSFEGGNLLLFCAAILISAVLTGSELPILKRKQFKQFIREEGPQSHLAKQGTPTMGGIAMFLALFIALFVFGEPSLDVAVILASGFLFGLIGFFDDYIKVAKKHNLGLTPPQKLVLQILFSVGLALYMVKYSGTQVWIPFYGQTVDFGWFYIPFIAFVVVAMANSVNLTDGLDGLSSGVTAIVAGLFFLAGQHFGNESASGASVALAGVCIGFLVYNRHPAKLFMGDTGSMFLGGALAAAAIVMKAEFLLPIAGLIYVLEALSVIIQVAVFKKTGKRVFKMAPLHHHFEMCGLKEVQVVGLFYGFTLVCCVIAYLIMQI